MTIPARMRYLSQDERGLPVPVIAMWTEDGKPLFAANDENERQRCFNEDRCHICGDRLQRGRWFVGGVLSTCAKHGLILDGGMHAECVHYALVACPYLAAPKYARLVGKQQLKSSDRAKALILATGTEGNPRPDLFVALMAVAQEFSRGSPLPGVSEAEIIYGVRPRPGAVRKVEVWRHGQQITDGVELERLRMLTAGMCFDAGDTMRADAHRLWSLP